MTATTYPGPSTLTAEAAVKDACSVVHDAALEVADEFDRLVDHRREREIPGELRELLAKLSAAFDAENAAYTVRQQALDAEWEAWKRGDDAEVQT